MIDRSALQFGEFGVNWDSPQAQGLVGWWPGCKFDMIGGWHGAVKGGAIRLPGQDHARTRFDGSNDWVDCGDYANIDGATALTVSAWVHPIVLVDFAGVVDKIVSHTGMFLIHSGAGAGDSTAVFVGARQGANTDDGFTATGMLAARRTNHLTYRFDGAGSGNAERLKCFVDGIERSLTFRGTIPASISANAQPLAFGGGDGSGNSKFNGFIWDVRVYKKALSPVAIRKLANRLTCRDLYRPHGRKTYVFPQAATPPNAPSDLTATANGTTINLAWTDNSDNETGFKVYRRQVS